MNDLLKINPARTHGAIREIALGSLADTFSQCLLRHARRNDRVCYVGVDTMDSAFEREFPDRAFDVGIAEQNELGLATGLAKTGLIPIVQGWSPFTPLRNFDQLRTYLARHKANVKIFTTTLGLANCSHGTTHHDLESIALYRVVPNLRVVAPFDDEQFAEAFDLAMAHEGPVVVMGAPEIYAAGEDGLMTPEGIRHEAPLAFGRAEWWKRGNDIALVSVGSALRYTWKAALSLEAQGISASVLNMCAIKPFGEEAILQAAREHRAILTIEEQSVVGGIGSATADILAGSGIQVAFDRIGIEDKFIEDLGDWTYTRRSANLTDGEVVRRAQGMLERLS